MIWTDTIQTVILVLGSIILSIISKFICPTWRYFSVIDRTIHMAVTKMGKITARKCKGKVKSIHYFPQLRYEQLMNDQ